jgi:hypothetical protein
VTEPSKTFTVYYQIAIQIEAKDHDEAADKADKLLDEANADNESAKAMLATAVWTDTYETP